MALSIHCGVCNVAEVVTVDRPEPLAGWLVTRGTNGIVDRVCPTCHGNQAVPSDDQTILVLDAEVLS